MVKQIESVMAMCSEIECRLAGHFHVALTGSHLYGKIASRRTDKSEPVDVDIVIYPHVRPTSDTSIPPTLGDEYLTSIGFTVLRNAKKENAEGKVYYVNKITKCLYGDRAVDVFFLE